MMPNSESESLRSPTDVAALFRLDGRTALVTGGSGVLGSALALGLGLAGARVVVASRNSDNVKRVAEEISGTGAEAMGVPMDVCDRDSVISAADEIESRFGTVDILINAAGGNRPLATATLPERSFFDLDPEALREVFDLNVMGGAILPSMVFGERLANSRKPGSIVNITSVAAREPLTRVLGYAAAKAAVANVTQWMAVYFAKEMGVPIRVNSLMPGFFLTEQNRFLLTNADGSPTARGGRIVDHTPMGRYGRADELVGACIYLAAAASSFVTGTTLTVDGGFTAYSGV